MASGKEHSTVTVRVSAGWVAEDWKRFVELPYFRAKWLHLGLGDEDLRALQIGLTVAATRWPVVGGTGGLRKMRFAPVKANRGKRGAFLIGYVYFEEFGVIRLIAVYAKKDHASIPARQKAQIKKAIEQLRDWISGS